jgi:hypothetical protein
MAAPGPPPNYEMPLSNLGKDPTAIHITQSSSAGNNGILFVAGDSSSPTMDFRSISSSPMMQDIEEKVRVPTQSLKIPNVTNPEPNAGAGSGKSQQNLNNSSLHANANNPHREPSLIKSFAEEHVNALGNPNVVIIEVTDPMLVQQVFPPNKPKARSLLLPKDLLRQFLIYKLKISESLMFKNRGHNETDPAFIVAQRVSGILSSCSVVKSDNSAKHDRFVLIVTCKTLELADLLISLLSKQNVAVRKDRSSVVVFKIGPFPSAFREANSDAALQAYFDCQGFKGKIKWDDRGATAVCLYSNVSCLINNVKLKGIQGKEFNFRRVLSPSLRLCSHCQSVSHKLENCPNITLENTSDSHYCRDCGKYHTIEHSEYSILKCQYYVQDETLCRFCVALGKDQKDCLSHRARNCPHIKSKLDSKFAKDFLQRINGGKKKSSPQAPYSSASNQSQNPNVGQQGVSNSNPKSYASIASSSSVSVQDQQSVTVISGVPPPLGSPPPLSTSVSLPQSLQQSQQLLDLIKDMEREKRIVNEKMEQERKAMNERIEQLVKQVELLTKLTQSLSEKLLQPQQNSVRPAASSSKVLTPSRHLPQIVPAVPIRNSFDPFAADDTDDDDHEGNGSNENRPPPPPKHDISKLSQPSQPGNMILNGVEFTPVKPKKLKKTQSVQEYQSSSNEDERRLETPSRPRHQGKSRKRSTSQNRNARD